MAGANNNQKAIMTRAKGQKKTQNNRFFKTKDHTTLFIYFFKKVINKKIKNCSQARLNLSKVKFSYITKNEGKTER